MTNTEIMEKKKVLQNTMLQLLRTFEFSTECIVDKITLKHEEGNSVTSVVVGVRLSDE
ncbi:MAG: hypothetical protein Q8N12_01390 [Thermodesulfovibrionales bacterium]|nr:hypothetical protein [Thermodesulfovibrionales bacterium]